ncbi:MBL fold metallo-hydrolase [Candidatus Dependentiae bacterium]
MKKFEKPRKVGNRFYSYVQENIVAFFVRSALMRIKSWWVRRKIKKSDVQCWFCKSEPTSCSIHPKITWIGHSSFLIQIGGVNILTDPVLDEPSFLFPRFLAPGIHKNKLPNIDFVLLSHNHPDHMDAGSLLHVKKWNDGTHFLVPVGDKCWFDNKSFVRVREYTWWQQDSFNLKGGSSRDIKFTFLPANHWSMRTLFDKKNRSLWGSWMIECNGHKIYFAGDSAYESHFSLIAKKFKNIDVALMPIGPCEPRSWVEYSHLDSKEAGKAFLDLQAKNIIPMHWATFPWGTEMFDEPVIRLKNWWQENVSKLEGKSLHLPKVGESIEFPELSATHDVVSEDVSRVDKIPPLHVAPKRPDRPEDRLR